MSKLSDRGQANSKVTFYGLLVKYIYFKQNKIFFFFFQLLLIGVTKVDTLPPSHPIPCILLRHINTLHILLHHIQKPSVSLPPALQLHIQHLLLKIYDLPSLYFSIKTFKANVTSVAFSLNMTAYCCSLIATSLLNLTLTTLSQVFMVCFISFIPLYLFHHLCS